MAESETNPQTESSGLGAVELLGIGGFALFFGWMFLTFYWLFTEFLQDLPLAERDVIQLFVFAGVTAGYGLAHLLAKAPKWNAFSLPVLIVECVLALLMPLASLALSLQLPVPTPLCCAVNLLGGIAGGVLTVSWLDACGRCVGHHHYLRFCGLSFLGGGLLFFIVAFMPQNLQPVFPAIYALLSIGLLRFVDAKCDDADLPALATVEGVAWKFTKEIEPSLVAFGVVFGMTFVYLFNNGATFVFLGLAAVIPGAAALVIASFRVPFINITLMQRVLLVVTVLSCLSIPFASKEVQLACAALVVATWAFFVPMNYAHITRKSVELGGMRIFRQIPSRLLMSGIGFLLGWGLACTITVVSGAHSEAFTVARLCIAFLVVLLVMLFFPDSNNHSETSDLPVPEQPAAKPAAVASDLTESELFERRCSAVADLYQLSPRESDILRFLAKGRNAAYIQNKLCISPHTVKSHIYSIYRKVDIHSQQKLMDFVEDYPVEPDAR